MAEKPRFRRRTVFAKNLGFGVGFRCCNNTTQLYVHCGHDNTALTIVRLDHCIMDIDHWMSANWLKLNIDKTELIWTGTKYSVTVRNASFLSLRLDADVILPSQHVHLLGVVISADLGLEKHVLNVSATCFCHPPATLTHPALTFHSLPQHLCAIS